MGDASGTGDKTSDKTKSANAPVSSSPPTSLGSAPLGAAPSDGKKTVDEWADELFADSPSGRPHAELWKHAVAAVLHNWVQAAHDNNQPMKLSRDEYLAAIDAANKPNDLGVCTPSTPALYRPRS